MNIRCSCWRVGVLIGTVLFACSPTVAAKARAAREVRSPDGKIAVTIHTDAPLGYSITVDGKPVLLRAATAGWFVHNPWKNRLRAAWAGQAEPNID